MAALPKEIDAYLKPFVRDAVGEPRLAAELVKAPGLDGGQGGENKILGKVNEPAIQEAYREHPLERSRRLRADGEERAMANEQVVRPS